MTQSQHQAIAESYANLGMRIVISKDRMSSLVHCNHSRAERILKQVEQLNKENQERQEERAARRKNILKGAIWGLFFPAVTFAPAIYSLFKAAN